MRIELLVLSALVRTREVLIVLALLVRPTVAPAHVTLILIPVHVISLINLLHEVMLPALEVSLGVIVVEVPVMTVTMHFPITSPIVP